MRLSLRTAGAAHWYDRFFILVWMSHFTVALTVAVVFWLRNRPEFVLWMRRYLIINFGALVCYVLVPDSTALDGVHGGQTADRGPPPGCQGMGWSHPGGGW